jgi:hypothetical protein
MRKPPTIALLLIPIPLACDGTAGAPPDVAADTPVDGPRDDVGPADSPIPPNIGVWCDPSESDSGGANPACVGGAGCLVFDDPPQNGMCVIAPCRTDDLATAVDEDDCRRAHGPEFVCVDLDATSDTSLLDNACVPVCTPRADGNDCEPEFACDPASTRFNFVDAVCLTLACPNPRSCPDGFECRELSGLCVRSATGNPSAAIGDPCATDDDRPLAANCLEENRFEATDGEVLRFPRNGTCTILGCRFAETLPDFACPAGTACYTAFFAGACMRTCDTADPAGCRGRGCDPAGAVIDGCDWLGDYECIDLTNTVWLANDLPVVVGDDPICDYLWRTDCNAALVCPAGRTCTDKLTGAGATEGVCLDATVSGPPCVTIGADGGFCDGECVDRDDDAANCGACGNVCAGSTPNCSAGTCVP